MQELSLYLDSVLDAQIDPPTRSQFQSPFHWINAVDLEQYSIHTQFTLSSIMKSNTAIGNVEPSPRKNIGQKKSILPSTALNTPKVPHSNTASNTANAQNNFMNLNESKTPSPSTTIFSKLTPSQHSLYLSGNAPSTLRDRIAFEQHIFRIYQKALCSQFRSAFLKCNVALDYIQSQVKKRKERIGSLVLSHCKSGLYNLKTETGLESGGRKNAGTEFGVESRQSYESKTSHMMVFSKTLLGTGMGNKVHVGSVILPFELPRLEDCIGIQSKKTELACVPAKAIDDEVTQSSTMCALELRQIETDAQQSSLTVPPTESTFSIPTISKDQHINSMLPNVCPNFTLSLSSLTALFCSPKFEVLFNVAIHNGKKCILFEDVLQRHEWTPREMMECYYKEVVDQVYGGAKNSTNEASDDKTKELKNPIREEKKESSLEYNLYNLGPHSILVRTPVHTIPSKRIHLASKISILYPETPTLIDRAQWLIASLVNKCAPVLVLSVNATQNNLVSIQEWSYAHLLGDGHWLLASNTALISLLDATCILQPGSYLLRKDKSTIIYKTSPGLVRSDVFKLVSDLTRFEYRPLEWTGPDTQVPYTFPPTDSFTQPEKLLICTETCIDPGCSKMHLDVTEKRKLMHELSPFAPAKRKREFGNTKKGFTWMDADRNQMKDVELEY